jgi:hypothetical protein
VLIVKAKIQVPINLYCVHVLQISSRQDVMTALRKCFWSEEAAFDIEVASVELMEVVRKQKIEKVRKNSNCFQLDGFDWKLFSKILLGLIGAPVN